MDEIVPSKRKELSLASKKDSETSGTRESWGRIPGICLVRKDFL